MIKKEKRDFNILTTKFSIRPSIEMIKQSISNHTRTDVDDLEYIRDHPFNIPDLSTGESLERRFTGLISRKAAAIYPFNLKKYRSKGTRLPTSRVGVTKEGEEKSYPNYEREQKGSQYVLRVYEIPLRNVRTFIQSGNDNYVSITTDSQLEYLETRWRGFPPNTDGVFDIEYLNKLTDGIIINTNLKNNCYHSYRVANSHPFEFESVDVRFNIVKKTFMLIDQHGAIITDPQILRTLFSPFK